jgi:hypothetical protein
LKVNPELGVTSKNRFLAAIRSGFGMYKLKTERVEFLVTIADDINPNGFHAASNLQIGELPHTLHLTPSEIKE